jgi:hypothetical protein
LISDALGLPPAMEKLAETTGATVIHYEPSLTLALEEGCRLQCRLSVETRTSAYQVRTGEFPEEQVSVYFTARQYGSLAPDSTFMSTLERLNRVCQETVDGYVIENVLEPLARAIAMK